MAAKTRTTTTRRRRRRRKGGNVDAVAKRLDDAAWRGGSADDLLYARCSKRVGLRPAAVLPMQAAAALVGIRRRQLCTG